MNHSHKTKAKPASCNPHRVLETVESTLKSSQHLRIRMESIITQILNKRWNHKLKIAFNLSRGCVAATHRLNSSAISWTRVQKPEVESKHHNVFSVRFAFYTSRWVACSDFEFPLPSRYKSWVTSHRPRVNNTSAVTQFHWKSCLTQFNQPNITRKIFIDWAQISSRHAFLCSQPLAFQRSLRKNERWRVKC